ncbi:MAG: amidohydrolase, partial [Xanthomonadales bacterium]|nr:amidohydrolase [Xanthomonadales bacterium]
MRAPGLFSLALAAGLLAGACVERDSGSAADVPVVDAADTVLLNGGIYTVAPDRSWAEALAVRDGVIVEVGGNEAVRPLIG